MAGLGGSRANLRRKSVDTKRNKTRPTKDVSTITPSRDNRRPSIFQKRRKRVSNAAYDPYDPCDEPASKRSKLSKGRRSFKHGIDMDRLSRPSSRVDEEPVQAEARLEKMRGAVRTLLECLGEDPDREGLLATPSRFAKALLFLTKGYQVNVKNIVNNALFYEGHNEMVIVKDIELHSLCEHHLLPFTGKMHIGYVPFETVIGLSKLPRIAEMFSRRLQIQERVTKEVAHAIMEILNPQGVAVVMESSHTCMVMRGVEKTGTSTITRCVLGCFKKRYKTRNEFMSLIGLTKK